MFGIDSKSYKELQTMAKQCRIPANMQRKFLIQAISAHESNELDRVESIISSYRTQQKRKISNRPQNLSKSKRKKNDRDNAAWKNKDGDIVDSTSSDTKELMPLEFPGHYKAAAAGYADSVSSTALDRYRYVNRYYPSQQLHCMYDFLNPASLSDNRFNTPFPYDYQMNLRNPPNVLAPYGSPTMSKFPLYQDLQHNYQTSDVASSSYYSSAGTYQPPSYLQQANSSNYDAGIANDNHLLSQNYHSQLSMDSGFESNSLVVTGGSHDEQLRMCSMSKNSYYQKDDSNNESHSIEVDSGSHLLPNIPQLNLSVDSDLPSPAENCASWPPATAVPYNSERTETHPRIPEKRNHFSYREISEIKRENLENPVSASLSAGFDSNSDEGTVSLSEDIVSFLELDRSLPNLSKVPAKPAYTSESYLKPTQTTYNGYRSSENGIILPNTSQQYQEDCSSTFGGTSNAMGELSVAHPASCSFPDMASSLQPCSQLPSIGTCFSELGHVSTGEVYGDQDHSSRMFRNPSAYSDGNYAASGNSDRAAELRNSLFDPNGMNLTSPEKLASECGDSIIQNLLRNRVLHPEPRRLSVSDYDNQSSNTVVRVQQNGGVMPPTVPVSERTNEIVVPNKIAQLKLKQQDIRKGQNAVLSSGGGQVTTNATWCAEKFENNGSVVNMKSAVGCVVYESETLHRSKIICEIPNDTSFKEESIRKFMQIIIPQDKCSPLTPVANSKSEQHLPGLKVSEASLATIPSCRPCVNKKRGCNVVVMLEYADIHEKQCVFQSVYCPSDSCSWLDTLNLLSQHIRMIHKTELRNRDEYVYVVDRKDSLDKTFHTFFQVHKNNIYVIRLHINDEKCVAVAQYISETESTTLKEIEVFGVMQLQCYSKKLRMKTWKGRIQPYHENDLTAKDPGVIQVNVHDSAFVILRFLVN